MAYVYFLYSSQQETFFKNVEASMGRTYKVGTVISKGTRKSFTEISNTPTNKYSDSRIVAKGEQSKFRYTLPSR